MTNTTIHHLPEEERPREKLLSLGPENLSNVELLALIIGSGTRDESALRLGERVLTKACDLQSEEEGAEGKNALYRLSKISLKDLREIKGIGEAKAATILSAMEIAKRISYSKGPSLVQLNSPGKVVDFVFGQLNMAEVEEFVLICLNTKKEVTSCHRLSKGTLNYTVVHPRDVFRLSIEKGAHSVILVHNHPSGHVEPSKEDFILTRRLVETGDLVGIPVLDHIILGGSNYYSFLEEGKMEG